MSSANHGHNRFAGPKHFSITKPTDSSYPPPICPQSNIKIKRKPVSSEYRTSLSPTLTYSHHGLEGLEVVESHGPEVTGGDGLIYMRDDDKHLSIQLPPGEEKIVGKEGGVRRRKRICGMNVWVIIALIVFLVIGAVVGGIVGAIKGRDTAATSEATVSPILTPAPKPKTGLFQPTDNTWYRISTSNPSVSSNATGLYLMRDSGGALRSYPPSPGFEQDQTFRFKSFQPSSSTSNTLVHASTSGPENRSNKITQTWSAAQINFHNMHNISRETPLYILQNPLANWTAILRYTNENGLGDLYLESANYANSTSSMHNDPAVWFWLEDRENGIGFYLKNVAAGKEKALTLLNYNGKDALVMSDLGITGLRNVDEEGVQAWNITETPKVEAYAWPYEW